MKKLVLLGVAAALAALLGLASGADPAAAGDKPAPAASADKCSDKLDTDLLKAACAKGGRKDAKAAMQAFLNAVKKKEKEADPKFKLACLDCHKDLKKHERKDNALADFQKYQGKLGDEYTSLVKKYQASK
jgi:hypothetical protein